MCSSADLSMQLLAAVIRYQQISGNQELMQIVSKSLLYYQPCLYSIKTAFLCNTTQSCFCSENQTLLETRGPPDSWCWDGPIIHPLKLYVPAVKHDSQSDLTSAGKFPDIEQSACCRQCWSVFLLLLFKLDQNFKWCQITDEIQI